MSENEPQTKNGMGGCLMTVVVIAVVLSITIAVGVVVAVRSPTGQKVLASVNQAKTAMERAAKAPGAAELKQTLCKDGAVVLDLDEMRKMTHLFETKEKPLKDTFPDARYQIVCNPGSGAVPTCEQVAQEYLKIVKDPGGKISVTVSVKNKQRCSRIYSATGEAITR
jgi:hypothetical protein